MAGNYSVLRFDGPTIRTITMRYDEIFSAPGWTAEAACGGIATKEDDPFFPDIPPGRPGIDRTDLWGLARKVCHNCPVLKECREEYWTKGKELQGMWFGLTPREREIYKRDRLKDEAA